MAPKKLIGLDFGAACCRVAYTQHSTVQGHYAEPQVVEFHGRPGLTAILCMDPSGAHVEAYGQTVVDQGLAGQYPDRIRQGFKARLGEDDEAARLARLLLAEAYRALAAILGADTVRDSQLTVGTAAAAGERFTAALREAVTAAGFPAPEIVPDAMAALAYHALAGDLGRPAAAGTYLVINAGAVDCELVLVDVPTDGSKPQLRSATRAERYGGEDLDEQLACFFLRKYGGRPAVGPRDPSLVRFCADFKETFFARLKAGEQVYEEVCALPGMPAAVSLSLAEFEQAEVAGELVDRFPAQITRALREGQVNASQVLRVLLVGGGAHWYFIARAARELLGDKVLAADQPEQTVVKGLARWPALPAVLPKPVESAEQPPAGAAGHGQKPGADKKRRGAGGAGPRGARGRPAQGTLGPWKKIPRSPGTAWVLEMLGLVGFLGIGWISMGNLGVGIPALVLWWFVLIGGGIGLIGLAVAQSAWWFLLLVAVWLGVPLLSGGLAAGWVRRMRERERGGRELEKGK